MPDLPWFVYAVPLGMVGIIAVAAFYKWLQVRAAAHWPQTSGKVVVSTSQVRKVETFDDDRDGGKTEEARNFAHIVYEYTVSGQKLRNDRVSIGEDLGNFEVAETIARYPVGKVVTVYYNPRKPREAVLEREIPKGLFGCVIWMVVIGVGGILGSFYGFNQITIVLTDRVQHAPMVVALSAMALVTILFGFAARKQGNDARKWPVVTGRIDKSEVDEFRGSISNDSKSTTLYRPLISFSYEYNGLKYVGSHVSLGVKVTSNSAAVAKKTVAKYPLGKTISVHVNPQNPSESTLSPSTGAAWFIWAIGAGLLGLAYFISQQP
jgi:hypothetical protein